MARGLTSPTESRPVHFERFPPSDYLRHWISGFFRWSGPTPERILPNAQFDLVFSVGEEPIDPDEVRVPREVRALLYCELRQPLSDLGNEVVDLFGISLYPWSSEAIEGRCARDLNGKVVPLRRIGQIECERIRAMLAECRSDFERVRMAEEVFSRILPEPGKVELALYEQWMATWESGGRIETIDFEDPDLGLARFRKIFYRRMGMTSRQFCRLARFHAFLRRLEEGEKISTLAEDIGYYDQAHLTRECRDFAGVPPRQLHVQLATGRRVFKREPALATIQSDHQAM